MDFNIEINNKIVVDSTTNIDILRIIDFKEPKNYSCQAQNYFGLVVFNLSVVIKGNYLFCMF